MSLPTLKIYVVSVSACQKSEDLLDTAKGMLYYEHSPVVVTGVNMQMAVSRHIALNKWKIEDGWSMHSASITAVTREFFDQVRALFQDNVLVFAGDHESEFFRFDESATTDFDNVISSDDN